MRAVICFMFFILYLASAMGGEDLKSPNVLLLDTSKQWQVDPSQFEFSMTVIGMIDQDGFNATLSSQEIGAFNGELLLGSAKAYAIEGTEDHVFFLTIFGNSIGDSLEFKLFDHETKAITKVDNVILFEPDSHNGEIGFPYSFFLNVSSSVDDVGLRTPKFFPNPTNTLLNIDFEYNSIYIVDQQGVLVKKIENSLGIKDSKQIDVSYLSTGKYYMISTLRGEKVTFGFIKI